MNAYVKAKVIIELLDDRKYAVLASLSDHDLERMSAVEPKELAKLSDAEVAEILNQFLEDVDAEVRIKNEEKKIEQPVIVEETPPAQAPSAVVADTKADTRVIEKLEAQPIQLLACVLGHLPEDKKQSLLVQLSEDKQNAIANINVDQTPVTDQVAKILIKQLALA